MFTFFITKTLLTFLDYVFIANIGNMQFSKLGPFSLGPNTLFLYYEWKALSGKGPKVLERQQPQRFVNKQEIIQSKTKKRISFFQRNQEIRKVKNIFKLTDNLR